MVNASISQLFELTEAERIQLAQDLWDSIPAGSQALPLSDDLRRELERRLAEYRANPASAIPWEEARARLRERFGA